MSAGAIRSGRGFIEMFLKDSALMRGLDGMRDRIQQRSRAIANIGLKIGTIGAGLVAPFVGAIRSASNFQEVMGKFDTVFGKNATAVKQWGDNYAGQVGRSQRQLAEFLAGNQDLFIPLGFDEGNATNLSKTVTKLAIDLASFNNKTDAEALDDLTGALTGSGERMKKYAVIVSEATVKQELLNQKIDPKKATEQEKVMARLAIILRGTSAAHGDAIRTAGSFANQMKALKGRIEDAANSIGGALLPVVTPLVTTLAAGVSRLTAWIGQNQQLVRYAFLAAAGIAALGGALVVAGIAGAVAAFTIGGIIAGLGVLSTIISAVISPLGLLAVGVVALAVGILKYTSAGRVALDFLAGGFGVLKDDATQALGVISKALAAGDISTAASVLWALLKLEWTRGTQYLAAKWAEFKGFFLDTWASATYGLSALFLNGLAGLQAFWVATTYGMGKAWTIFTSTVRSKWDGAQNWISRQLLKLQGQIDQTFDVEGAIAQLEDANRRDSARADAEVAAKLAEAEKTRADQLTQIERDRKGSLNELARDRDRDRNQLAEKQAAALAEAQTAVDAAKTAYNAAIKAATDKLPDASKTPTAAAKEGLDANLAGLTQKITAGVTIATDKIQSTGALGGRAAELIFGRGDNTPREQLAVARQALDEQRRTRRVLERPPAFT